MKRDVDVLIREIAMSYRNGGKKYLPASYLSFVCAVLICALLSYWQYVCSEGYVSLIGWGVTSFFLFSMITISVGHQAFHGAFTGCARIDRVIGALAFIPLGLDGHLWKRRHISEHHREPNRQGYDEDIDNPVYFRLAPYSQHRWYHRFQHLYAPFLYSIGLPITITIDDVRQLIREVNRLKTCRSYLAVKKLVMRFTLGKILFVGMWVVVPLSCSHIASVTTGVVLILSASIPVSWFFLPIGAAHLNDHTQFYTEDEGADFFSQQSKTTVDFSRDSTLVTWMYGGLNCHLAHHLWPRIPAHQYHTLTKHLHHRLKTPGGVVRNLSFFELYRSHFKLLRRLGSGR